LAVTVARAGDMHKYMYLHFPTDGVIPPSEYIYSAKIQLNTVGVYGDQAPPWTVIAYGPPGIGELGVAHEAARA